MHKPKVAEFLAAASIVLLLIVLSIPVLAQDNSGPVSPIAPILLGDGWWHSMTVDVQGNVHVAWYWDRASTPDNAVDVLAYRKRSFSGEWTDENDIMSFGPSGWTVRNALAATNDGFLHAVFRGYEGVVLVGEAPIADSQSAAAWSPPIRLNDWSYYVDMISDRKDILHLVFSGRLSGIDVTSLDDVPGNRESGICIYCNDLFYVRSLNGGDSWELPIPISIVPNSGADRVQIFEGMSGRIYITWEEGPDWYQGRMAESANDVRMAYSDDSGVTWSEPIVFPGEDASYKPLQIAAAESGNHVVVVWSYNAIEERHIYYQVSTDSALTWSKPKAVPNVFKRDLRETPLDQYTMVADRIGLIHLFAVGQPNETTTRNASLYHLIYQPNGDKWSSPRSIFYSPEQRPEWPEAAIGLSNDIHLTWFIRGIRENFDGYQGSTDILKVYYGHIPGNLSSQPTRVFIPTETPLPTLTPFRLVEATATPVPTVRPLETELALTTRDNYATQTLLGSVVIVGLLCAGLVVFIRLRGR